MIVMAHCTLRMGLFHCNISRVAAEDLLTVVAGLVWLFQLGLFWGWGGERDRNQTMESRQLIQTMAISQNPGTRMLPTVIAGENVWLFPQSISQVTGPIPKWSSFHWRHAVAASFCLIWLHADSNRRWLDRLLRSRFTHQSLVVSTHNHPVGSISKMHWPTQPMWLRSENVKKNGYIAHSPILSTASTHHVHPFPLWFHGPFPTRGYLAGASPAAAAYNRMLAAAAPGRPKIWYNTPNEWWWLWYIYVFICLFWWVFDGFLWCWSGFWMLVFERQTPGFGNGNCVSPMGGALQLEAEHSHGMACHSLRFENMG